MAMDATDTRTTTLGCEIIPVSEGKCFDNYEYLCACGEIYFGEDFVRHPASGRLCCPDCEHDDDEEWV